MADATRDVVSEVKRLLAEGKTAAQARLELEQRGFSTGDLANAIAEATRPETDNRTAEERRNGRLFATREVFDRVGYGGATPQFVNILFWLSQSASPFVLPIIGLLNGINMVLSVVWSSLLREYSKLHRVSKNSIAAAGIIFGFSFLFMSFGLLLGSIWLFSAAFIVGAVGVVAYGDLYQKFVRDTIRRERMNGFLRGIGKWGVLITAITLLLAGFLMDAFPMAGTPWAFTLFGKAYNMRVYGYLLAFELTAFAFIIAGYVSSMVTDRREAQSYPFWQFLRENSVIVKSKISIFWMNKYVSLLLLASIITGILQIIVTAYGGIAIYQIVAKQTSTPFFTLAVIYAIAIIASFTGPFFTERIHRSTGLAPTLVFGTMLTAILPIVLVYNAHVAAIAAAMCMYVIGGAIVGFAQGLLAKKLMDEETRHDYFRTLSLIIVIPYVILIPLIALSTMYWSLSTLFLIAAAGLLVIVMPIYFVLVVISQHQVL